MLFTLPTQMFTQKKHSLSQTIFVPPSYIVAGAKSGTLYRWVLPEKIENPFIYPAFEISKHIGNISTMHWSDDLKLLFTGSADRTVMVWTMNTRVPPKEPQQVIHVFEGTPLSMTTYMNYLFVAESTCISVLLLQTIKGAGQGASIFRKVKIIEPERGFFTCLCFSPNPSVDNSGYLFAGFDNGTIMQYDAQLSDKPTFTDSNRSLNPRGRPKPKFICQNSIFKMEYIHREGVILVFSYDRHIRIFNPRNNRVVNVLKNPLNVDFVSAAYENSSMQYLLSDSSGYLYVWEVTETTRILLQTQFSSSCESVVQASPGYFLYLQREGASLIDINRGTVKTSYQIHSGTVFYINAIEDSSATLLVTAGDDRFVRFWDPRDFSMRMEHHCPTFLAILSAYVGVRERQNSNLIWCVTGHDEGKLFFSNITDHKNVELPSKHHNSISCISVIQREMKVILFACDYDGFVSIWSIDSILENISYAAVSLIKMWKAHDQEILTSSGQWSSDSCVFATGGNDKVIKIWQEVEGTFVDTPLRGHTDSVTALVFEGFFLFSGGEDLTIRIWDTVNFVQLAMITQLHSSAIRNIFHMEGENKIAACDAKGTVTIYDYVKKKELWKVKHSSDCRCIHVERSMNKLFACVKSELIPHSIPEIATVTQLPPLTGSAPKGYPRN